SSSNEDRPNRHALEDFSPPLDRHLSRRVGAVRSLRGGSQVRQRAVTLGRVARPFRRPPVVGIAGATAPRSQRSANGWVSTDCSTGLLREVPATAATAAATTTRAAWTSDGTTMVTSGWIPTMVNPPAAAPNVTNTAEDTVMGIALWRARAPWSWDVGVPVSDRAASVFACSSTEAADPTPVAAAAWISAIA